MVHYKIPTHLAGKTFLVDTNFFIDSFSDRVLFRDFIVSLKNAEIVLVSISFVCLEFVRSKTIDVVKRKNDHYSEIVEFELPYDKKLEVLAMEMIKEYKQYMEGLPLTDLIIAAYLKRYSKLYLLTRDHRDFPTTVFDRLHIFPIQSIRDVKTYGVYAYRPQEKIISGDIPF